MTGRMRGNLYWRSMSWGGGGGGGRGTSLNSNSYLPLISFKSLHLDPLLMLLAPPPYLPHLFLLNLLTASYFPSHLNSPSPFLSYYSLITMPISNNNNNNNNRTLLLQSTSPSGVSWFEGEHSSEKSRLCIQKRI